MKDPRRNSGTVYISFQKSRRSCWLSIQLISGCAFLLTMMPERGIFENKSFRGRRTSANKLADADERPGPPATNGGIFKAGAENLGGEEAPVFFSFPKAFRNWQTIARFDSCSLRRHAVGLRRALGEVTALSTRVTLPEVHPMCDSIALPFGATAGRLR